jgi:hypothetical protein
MNGPGAGISALFFGAFLSFSGVPTAPGTLAVESVVRSGHPGTILDIVHDEARGVLLSAGADGTLRVWNARSHALLRRIPVTRRTVKLLAMSPSAPLAAVAAESGARSWELSIWNWETASRISALTVEDEPLFMRFSRSGTYLLYGLMSSNSFHMVDARDASPFPLPPLGMVAFAEVSRTDRTLMTYELSGRIRYRDLAAGTTLRDVTAAAGLRDIAMTQNNRIMIGRVGSVVTGIDALTGANRFSFMSPGLASLDVSPMGDLVACMSRDGLLQVSSFGIDSATFHSSLDGTHPGAARVRLTAGGAIVAGADGMIEEIEASGSTTAFTRDEIQAASAIALTPSTLAIASARSIVLFPLDAVAERVAPVTIANPFGAPVALRQIDDGSLLAWPEDRTGIAEVDLTAGTLRHIDAALARPLLDAAAYDGRLFTLEKGGRISMLDAGNGNVLFTALRPGATCIAAMGDTTLIVGHGPSAGIDGSLVRIDTLTGETVPLAGPNICTGKVIADPPRGLLYSLGVDGQDRTNLVRHSGAGLETDMVIDSRDGDGLASWLSLDSADGFLYSTLGSSQIDVWDGGAITPLSNPDCAAIAVSAADGLIASLDADSLVSLWDAAHTRQLVQIAVFPDDGWAALMPDGSFAGSETGRSHVAVVLKPAR